VYYNNAPSKLDPNFQAVSTLTSKGAEFSRQAGTGIAIVELSLLDANGVPVGDINFGVPVSAEQSALTVPLEALRFRKVEGFPASGSSIFLRVRIIDTKLQCEYLHDWIALTLNQALIGWATERLIERKSLHLLKPLSGEPNESTYATDLERKLVIDGFCPGLPALMSILESSHDLPHPAVAKADFRGVIRASSVATSTLDLLENSLLTPLLTDSNVQDPVQKAKADMYVVRLSRSEKPRLVSLEWDKSHREARVSVVSAEGGNQESIRDSPIDCPEYICFYCWTDFGNNGERIDAPSRMYREIMVDGGINEKSATIEFLGEFKKRNPGVFTRSFAFVFSVKRDRRSLWAYNWNPQTLKT
jgi:hypothetical protein